MWLLCSPPFQSHRDIFNTARLEEPLERLRMGWQLAACFNAPCPARFCIGLTKMGHSDNCISTGAHPTSGKCLMVCSAPVHSISILPPPSTRRPSAAVCRTPAPRRERDSLPSGASGEPFASIVVLRVFELAR